MYFKMKESKLHFVSIGVIEGRAYLEAHNDLRKEGSSSSQGNVRRPDVTLGPPTE